MTLSARMSLMHTIARVGMVLFIPFSMTFATQAHAADGGPTFAEVPDDISVKFMFKNSGNYNMVGTLDIPVIVSVVLTNKSEESLTVFVTRFLSVAEDKPLDFPL